MNEYSYSAYISHVLRANLIVYYDWMCARWLVDIKTVQPHKLHINSVE